MSVLGAFGSQTASCDTRALAVRRTSTTSQHSEEMRLPMMGSTWRSDGWHDSSHAGHEYCVSHITLESAGVSPLLRTPLDDTLLLPKPPHMESLGNALQEPGPCRLVRVGEGVEVVYGADGGGGGAAGEVVTAGGGWCQAGQGCCWDGRGLTTCSPWLPGRMRRPRRIHQGGCGTIRRARARWPCGEGGVSVRARVSCRGRGSRRTLSGCSSGTRRLAPCRYCGGLAGGGTSTGRGRLTP